MLVRRNELIDHMSGISLSPAQRDDAERVLAGVQRNLERYLHRDLESNEWTETVQTDSFGYAALKHTPITALLHVVDAGEISFPYTCTFERSRIIGPPMSRLVVTYVAGLGFAGGDEESQDVKLAIMDVAARIMSERHDDSHSVKDLNADDPGTKGEGLLRWTPAELEQFDSLRRRVVAT